MANDAQEQKLRIMDPDGNLLHVSCRRNTGVKFGVTVIHEWRMYSRLSFVDKKSAQAFLEIFPEIEEAGGRIVRLVNGKFEPVL